MTPLIFALAASSPAPVLLVAAGLFVFGLIVFISGMKARND